MFRIVLIISLLFSSIFAMSDKELAVTINLSGKQRMLTQKMTKEALLIKLGIDKNENIKKLKKTSALFDETLKGLQKGDDALGLVPAKNKKVQAKLKEIQKLWEPFYSKIKDIYTQKDLSEKTFKFIEQNNMKLLKEMNEAVSMYAALGDKGGNKLKMANDINLAGKQRMLTQKMAKDLLLYQAGIEPQKAKKDLISSKELFTKTLKGLYNGDKELNLVGTKLPNIRLQLDLTKMAWQKVEAKIPKAIENKSDLNLTKEVIKGLDKTKFLMNKAVYMYANSINRQKQILKLNSIISGFMHKKNNAKHLINLAGKQRMLTQRISKLAIECTLEIIPDSCIKLKQFIQLYHKTLLGFKNGDKELGLEASKNKEALAQIDKLLKLWKPFSEAAMKVQNSRGKDKKALEYILAHNEELLKESDNLVKIFDKINQKNVNYIEKAEINIVDIAGRQRMLTQKMTKEFLAYDIMKKKEYKAKMEKTIKLFDNSLKDLLNGNKKLLLPKATNPVIIKQLKKVSKLWQKIMPFYNKNNISQKELVLLLEANPILLKEMDKAVGLIEHSTEY